MANSILTPTEITRECLRVLHQKANFIGAVNRQYDNRFAQSGAKIGTSLNIRMPPKYTTTTGASLSAQDYVDRSTPLTVSSQIHVDVSFTTLEMTMQLDEFSDRFIKPAMAQLAATIESNVLTAAYKVVPEVVGTTNAALTYKEAQSARARLSEKLAPPDMRTLLLNPTDVVEFNDATKGLFQPVQNLSGQFREGMLGRTGGFDVFENTLLPTHATGSAIGASAVTTGATLGVTTTANSWSSQTTLSVTGATSASAFAVGDVITLSGVYDVHPESKTKLNRLKNFVVQTAVTLTTAATNYAVVVWPALITGSGNAYQNASLSGVSDTSGLTVTRILGASATYNQSLAFHQDAFVFATADLIDVSQYGAWGAREVMDGISMRIAQQYAIGTDTVPCRIDVLYGFAPLYPELAVRLMHA